MITIGVFFGGRSVEHEISVISAVQAIRNIGDKYRVIPIYIAKNGLWYSGDALLDMNNYKNLDNLFSKCEQVYMMPIYNDSNVYKANPGIFGKKAIGKIDIAFPVMHGTFGEDGVLQGFLELVGIPYVGSDVLASAVGMDKIMMKMILAQSGIPVVPYVWFTGKEWYQQQSKIIEEIEKLGFPVIVKPANLGSSVGISKATDLASLEEGIELANNFSDRILIEKMVVQLKEINCSVLGDTESVQTSTLEEPMRNDVILSYEDKYMSKSGTEKGMSGTQRKIPADLSAEVEKTIRSLAAKTFKVLNNTGVARIDFMIDMQNGKIYVNEINTIPGSLSFYLWKPSGKDYPQLLEEMIQLALKRYREKNNLVVSYDVNIFEMQGNYGKTGKKG